MTSLSPGDRERPECCDTCPPCGCCLCESCNGSYDCGACVCYGEPFNFDGEPVSDDD